MIHPDRSGLFLIDPREKSSSTQQKTIGQIFSAKLIRQICRKAIHPDRSGLFLIDPREKSSSAPQKRIFSAKLIRQICCGVYRSICVYIKATSVDCSHSICCRPPALAFSNSTLTFVVRLASRWTKSVQRDTTASPVIVEVD